MTDEEDQSEKAIPEIEIFHNGNVLVKYYNSIILTIYVPNSMSSRFMKQKRTKERSRQVHRYTGRF